MKKVDWQEPVVQEWDRHGGLTEFNCETGQIRVFVPREDSFEGRTIRRHEMLHAKYDRPDGFIGQDKLSQLTYAMGMSNDLVHHAVADAFVHLDYWPREYGTGESVANSDALEVAMDLFLYLYHTPKGLLHPFIALDTLRAMATVAGIGQMTHRTIAAATLAQVCDGETVDRYFEVLRLVKQNRRRDAELMFEAALTPRVRELANRGSFVKAVRGE